MVKIKACCFVERLTLSAGVFHIVPFIIKHAMVSREIKLDFFYIDANFLGKKLAKILSVCSLCSFTLLDFRLIDVRDENGLLVRLRIAFNDMMRIQENIVHNAEFIKEVKENEFSSATVNFLRRRAVSFHWNEPFAVLKLIYLIEVAHWKINNKLINEFGEFVFFADYRSWSTHLAEHANQYDIQIKFMRLSNLNIRIWIKNFFGAKLLGAWYYYFIDKGVLATLNLFFLEPVNKTKQKKEASKSKLLVDYYGHLYLDQPKFVSELFFLHQSKLKSDDISVLFNIKKDPLDQEKLNQLYKKNITAITANSLANKSSLPVAHNIDFLKQRGYAHAYSGVKHPWFKQHLKDYNQQYAYWRFFFEQHNIKTYVSWYKYGDSHCAIADALKDNQGALALYQRSFEEFPSVDFSVTSDVYFAFSKSTFNLIRDSKSTIPYFIQTGYLGDHRFDLLKDDAKSFRMSLEKAGASNIIAFFDEGSQDDERWHTGHEFMRENYIFILEKVLNDSTTGLLLKPKAPFTLKKRLGPVAKLLEQALATGRCIVVAHDEFIGASYVPAVAAMAADVSIHGHLCACTAGLESALAGTPTLILDREGWRCSPLYEVLGKDEIIFDNWVSLWEKTEQLLQQKNQADIGRWATLIKEADPFCDGLAAQRMGNYLCSIMEGFKCGLPRETVLADVAQRYADQWGKDKVLSIR